MSKYISLENLERYDAKMQEYLASFCASKEDGMWRQTEKAGAVSFWPVGNSPLEGTVEFMFKETPPANGDKSPSNPSTISGVSSVKVTRCGKNLAELNRVYALPGRGITAAVNADGSVHVEGTSDSLPPLIDIGNHDDFANKQLPYWMEVGKTYTISFNSSNVNGNPYGQIYLTSSLTVWGSPHTVFSGESYTFLVDDTIKRALIRIGLDRNSTINCDCYIQIEEGSSATSFDGTIPSTYTHPFNGTYYGGSINLATGLMTVTHEGFAYTGTENIKKDSTYGFYYDSTQHPKIKTSTSFTTTRFNSSGSNSMVSFSSASNSNFGWSTATSATWATVDDLKSWLASLYASNAPLVIAYELATPFTVQLSPPALRALPQPNKYVPRINTVYTDADAVQIVYQKNPVRDKFEKVQAIIAQGGNV